jgi:hypothetical protein
MPVAINILGREFTQYELDSEGEPPNMPPGTRITFCPDKDESKEGVVLVQILHHDCGETFFGNVIIKMDDGRHIEANCWQCKEVTNGLDT